VKTLEDLRRDIATSCAQLGADELDLVENLAWRLVMGANGGRWRVRERIEPVTLERVE